MFQGGTLKFFVAVKQFSKRVPIIEKKPYILDTKVDSLKDLIVSIVSKEVEVFNDSIDSQEIIKCLTSEEISNHVLSGKVSLGHIENTKKQELGKAIDNALQSFDDGLYAVFINDVRQEDLDEEIVLKENDTISFIRLVMLAGRMW